MLRRACIRRLATIFLALCLIPSFVFAEPGPIVDYLMKGEVSRFSFGLYRLDQRIKEVAENYGRELARTLRQDLGPPDSEGWYLYKGKRVYKDVNADAFFSTAGAPVGISEYDWDKNRIVIKLEYLAKPIFDPDSAKSTCKVELEGLRTEAGWDRDKNEWRFGAKHSRFANLFSDIGFRREADPKDLYEKLDSIIELTVEINPYGVLDSDGAALSFYPSATCTGALLSNEVLFSE